MFAWVAMDFALAFDELSCIERGEALPPSSAPLGHRGSDADQELSQQALRFIEALAQKFQQPPQLLLGALCHMLLDTDETYESISQSDQSNKVFKQDGKFKNKTFGEAERDEGYILWILQHRVSDPEKIEFKRYCSERYEAVSEYGKAVLKAKEEPTPPIYANRQLQFKLLCRMMRRTMG